MRVLPAALLLLVSAAFSGRTYPTDYFRSPLGIPLLLSGSFGEMRSNHFHSGIDIRTNAREGYRVYAAADGYVARIAVSPFGFGNALYVRHPNGYTTVYGHLQRFDDRIQEYTRRAQYRDKSFSVDLYPDATTFPVKKGEAIAISGNSGGSGGPHLHFEIRDSGTEWPINPLLFGVPVKDSKPPQIRTVKIYAADPESFAVIRKAGAQPVVVSFNRPAALAAAGGGSSFRLQGVESIEARGRIGFGIELRDTHDGSGFRLGAYEVELTADGELLHGYRMESFGFDQSRYINAHVDYEERVRNSRWIQRAYRLPGNSLGIYLQRGDGWLEVAEGRGHDLRFRVSDAFDNRTTLGMRVDWAVQPVQLPVERISYATVVPQAYPHVFTENGIAVTFPAGAVYDDLPLRYENEGPEPFAYSDVHVVHDRYTPVHESYTISIRADRLPPRLHEKAVMAFRDDERPNRFVSLGGKFENGYVTTRSRVFGAHFVTADTTAPTIVPTNITSGRNMRGQSGIRLKVDDDLSGLSTYAGFVNDEWVLFAYDAKRDLMEYTFDDRVGSGRHRLRFVAQDQVGNRAEYTAEFVR